MVQSASQCPGERCVVVDLGWHGRAGQTVAALRGVRRAQMAMGYPVVSVGGQQGQNSGQEVPGALIIAAWGRG